MKDKELLLKDLAARLPYGVICKMNNDGLEVVEQLKPIGYLQFTEGEITCIPYLRPMSSMTEEERNYIQECIDIVSDENYEDGYSPSAWSSMTDFTDYCNSRHLDYRNLIGEGLALEAPSDMYKEE